MGYIFVTWLRPQVSGPLTLKEKIRCFVQLRRNNSAQNLGIQVILDPLLSRDSLSEVFLQFLISPLHQEPDRIVSGEKQC